MEPLKLSTMHSEEFDKHMSTAVDLTPLEEMLEREENKTGLEKASGVPHAAGRVRLG